MTRLLELLRYRSWYKPLVTSVVARWFLSLLPRRAAFRILKRQGPVPVRVRVGKYRFWIVTSSEDDHYLEVLLNGLRNWEPESLKVWSELCSKGGTVVDVGAYAGVYAALAISAGADRVIAYEPNPDMFERLKETIEMNGFSGRATLRNVAVSSRKSQESLMVLADRPSSSAAHLSSVDSDPNYGWKVGPSVSVVTLDMELLALRVEDVVAVKVDTEGAEPQVLAGGMNFILQSHPVIIVECLSLEALNQVIVVGAQLKYSKSDITIVEQTQLRREDAFTPGNYLMK